MINKNAAGLLVSVKVCPLGSCLNRNGLSKGPSGFEEICSMSMEMLMGKR